MPPLVTLAMFATSCSRYFRPESHTGGDGVWYQVLAPGTPVSSPLSRDTVEIPAHLLNEARALPDGTPESPVFDQCNRDQESNEQQRQGGAIGVHGLPKVNGPSFGGTVRSDLIKRRFRE